MKRAFTLVEVLVTAAIIALLLAILLPSLSRARQEARRAACLANLKQLGVATGMYLDANRDEFWRYYEDESTGRRWWFGFEPGGPPSDVINTRHRPLEKARGILARHLMSTDDGLQCPAFPYSSGAYWPKFAERSASYGYNINLGPPNPRVPGRRRTQFLRRTTQVFVFADGVHYDFQPDQRLNEGFFIDYMPQASSPSGYAHFRHAERAQVQFMDGHATGQPLRGPIFDGIRVAGPAGNLSDSAGGTSIYGIDTLNGG